jgi:hypothetical protein
MTKFIEVRAFLHVTQLLLEVVFTAISLFLDALVSLNYFIPFLFVAFGSCTVDLKVGGSFLGGSW